MAGGAGFVSTTWRVVVDFDTSILTTARNHEKGAAILGPLVDKTQRALPPPRVSEIEPLAGRLIHGDTTAQTVFSADSVGLLVIVDDGRAYLLTPPGPITQGLAAQLHRMLYKRAWPSG